MTSLISSFESILQLQSLILGCGLVTFCAFVLNGTDPLCTWLEWA